MTGFNSVMLKACKFKSKLRTVFRFTHSIKTLSKEQAWHMKVCILQNVRACTGRDRKQKISDTVERNQVRDVSKEQLPRHYSMTEPSQKCSIKEHNH